MDTDAKREELILGFLDTAPTEISAWAAARAEAIREGRDRYVDLVEIKSNQPDPELAAAELGENSDLFVSTPANRARRQPAKEKHVPKTLLLVLVTVLIAAAGVGIYTWGKPEPAQDPHGGMSMGGEDPAAIQARMKELQEITDKEPKNIDAHLEYGLLLFNFGDFETAESQWNKVIEIDPNNVQAWYNIGFCAVAKEPIDQARAHRAWSKVIEIDPDSPLAKTAQNHMSAVKPTTETPQKK
ncbi:Hypothetical protein CpMEX30_1936 [Corynebacterium pseudotuberculosis]|uniref:tetratricopeptide repeat protein n=1 Tax=Corynebacterium pseudotuberculosis TaxID=1719 RepID=UPI00094751DA|nr:hypothetical protein [Corynebacterium pseudotuberculosis]APQ54928.1 Hypothetical protein CpMEX30_1936 [Corynebacterium pseudotuberculosis]